MRTQKKYNFSHPFKLESGQFIPNLSLSYCTWGQRNSDDSNIIWVFHALTANADVESWWPNMFGSGKILDPTEYFIICVNVLGSPYGSTAADNIDFPLFSVRDTTNAFIQLANFLNIQRIKMCIGGSFGGMQALEFAYRFPGRIDHNILIASSAKESAWAIAVHETQRLALKSDPTFGTKDGGQEGLKAARAIGMLTYRTTQLYIDKQTDTDEKTDDFQASSYMQYQGEKFTQRFDALSYFYLTKCLDSHDIGRNRGGLQIALGRISISTLVVSISSDMLVPPPLQVELHKYLPNSTLVHIDSNSGHDGFLIDTKKISKAINAYLNNTPEKRAVHKFGGKSLANGEPIQKALDIIQKYHEQGPIVLIVSARGQSTDQLESLYKQALTGQNLTEEVNEFINYQIEGINTQFEGLTTQFRNDIEAIHTLKIKSDTIKNKLLAYGELFSSQFINEKLKKMGFQSVLLDACKLIYVESDKDSGQVDMNKTMTAIRKAIVNIPSKTIVVIPGYIASDENGNTTNLGRNGSNYSAAIVSRAIKASAMYNWTDVDGIFSSNPKWVNGAKLIEHLSFQEANSLANFGAKVLHPMTILPLYKSKIPLIIKNSLNQNSPGTRVDDAGDTTGIKAVNAIEDITLISIQGQGLRNRVGIDARIFSALERQNISIRLISQASTELGIGFVIDSEHRRKALSQLHSEFQQELKEQVISKISGRDDVAIISITGKHNYALEKAIHGLREQKIWIYLFSNSMDGQNISLVVNNNKLRESLNIVHGFVV